MAVSATSAPPAAFTQRAYHAFRKRLHLICFLIFVALPFSNLMRVDIPRQRFYFFGAELWINEFGILFFVLMFLMFLIAASAIVYGRVYCSYMCPQMIFSEVSLDFENRVKKWVTKKFISWPAARRNLLSRALFYGGVGLASVFLAFVFTSYFVEPRDLLGRLFSFDVVTAGGITGVVVTLITFLDFTLVRQRFCTTVCPYGYLQGMLSDNQTLLVVYQDNEPKKACIECKKCVRVCEMGIDIRDSAYQIECIHCGECIDACDEIMGKLKKPGLIHYAWGEKNVNLERRREPLLHRLGLRDAKRVVVMLVLLFYAGGLAVALSMRRPVMVQVAGVRTEMFRKLPDGRIANFFRLKLVNRSSRPSTVTFAAQNLPGAEITIGGPIALREGEVVERQFEIRVAPFAGAQDVNRFRLLVQPNGEKTPDEFDLTFLMPPPERRSP